MTLTSQFNTKRERAAGSYSDHYDIKRHEPIVHCTVRMTSDYNNESEFQQSDALYGTELIRKYAKALIVENSTTPPQEYVISEFGCATGSNSIAPITAFVETVDAPVTAVMNDLIDNDWSTLVQTLKRAQNQTSFQIEIAAHSMYHRPTDRKAHIAFSNFAIQWLSSWPVSFEEDIVANHLPLADERHKVWREHSRKDLQSFLNHRATDVRTKGYLVLQMLGQSTGKHVLAPVYTLLAETKKQLLEEGILTVDEAKSLVCPEYFRSEDMVMEILEEQKQYWNLLEHKKFQLECSYVKQMKSGAITPLECARKQVGATRAWASWFVDLVLLDHRKAALFWERMEQLACSDESCQAASYNYTSHYFVLQRR